MSSVPPPASAEQIKPFTSLRGCVDVNGTRRKMASDSCTREQDACCCWLLKRHTLQTSAKRTRTTSIPTQLHHSAKCLLPLTAVLLTLLHHPTPAVTNTARALHGYPPHRRTSLGLSPPAHTVLHVQTTWCKHHDATRTDNQDQTLSSYREQTSAEKHRRQGKPQCISAVT